MNSRSKWARGPFLLVFLAVSGMSVPDVSAKGGGKGHAAAYRAPRVAVNHQAKAMNYRVPSRPRAMTPSRSNVTRTNKNNYNGRVNNNVNRTVNPAVRGNLANSSRNLSTTGTNLATGTNLGTTGRTPTNTNSNAYTYGQGTNARNYRAYGYGRGYRNRYQGSGYGYGRSQTNTRGIVSRLRSVHSGLARVDHDYQGHRVQAMHSISMAVRQLSHRSSVYQNTGFASGRSNGQNRTNTQLAGGGAGNRGGQRMSQAQSDSRMSQSLRTLQGINMQLTSQGTNTSGHSRARGHLQYAMRELNTALSVR